MISSRPKFVAFDRTSNGKAVVIASNVAVTHVHHNIAVNAFSARRCQICFNLGRRHRPYYDI